MLLEFNKNYIPLFLEMNDYIISYIIDNTFLGSNRHCCFAHYPYRAFSLLYELYNNDISREVFPESLQQVLDVDFNLPKWFNNYLLIGDDDHIYRFGIKIDMNITENSDYPVQLSNIRYYHGYSPFTLNRTINLTSIQAFYLFANLLTNNRCFSFQKICSANDLLSLSLENFISKIVLTDRWRSERFGKVYTILNHFSFEYLKFLTIELNKNHLSPASLLHFSGATTLAYLRYFTPVDKFLTDIISILRNSAASIHYCQRVLYYTLLYSSLNYTNTEDKVFRFIDNGSTHTKNFYDRDIAKEFPYSEELADF